MPFLICLFPLRHSSSAQHGYGFLACCNFEGDHIDSMSVLVDAVVAPARPGKAVHVDETLMVVLRWAS